MTENQVSLFDYEAKKHISCQVYFDFFIANLARSVYLYLNYLLYFFSAPVFKLQSSFTFYQTHCMEILEIVIGLIFIYLLLSLLTSTIQELVASLVSLRGKMLLKAILKLLEVENLAGTENEAARQKMLEEFKTKIINSKVYKKYSSKFLWIRQLPSYLSAEQVTGLIQDLTAEEASSQPSGMTGERGLDAPAQDGGVNMLDAMHQSDLKKQLGIITGNAPAGGGMGLRSLDGNPEEEEATMNHAKAVFKMHYDEIMDRCTDWYKRSVHISLIAIGMVIAVAFDADTFKIFNSLTNNPNDRQELMQLAESFVSNNKIEDYTPTPRDSTASDSAKLVRVTELRGLVDSILYNEIKKVPAPLGLGWNPSYTDQLATAEAKGRAAWLFFLIKLFGWFITALAVSLGAPFWFDLMQKVINVRNAGVRPQSGGEKQQAVTGGKS